YLDGFDNHTGWGFLKADNLFEMLDPDGEKGYRLKYVDVSHDDIDTSADWADFGQIFLFNPIEIGTHGGDMAPEPRKGVYFAKIREIKATTSYEGLGMNRDFPVYVWGNGKGFRGVPNTNWNFREHWCEVVKTYVDDDGY